MRKYMSIFNPSHEKLIEFTLSQGNISKIKLKAPSVDCVTR